MIPQRFSVLSNVRERGKLLSKCYKARDNDRHKRSHKRNPSKLPSSRSCCDVKRCSYFRQQHQPQPEIGARCYDTSSLKFNMQCHRIRHSTTQFLGLGSIVAGGGSPSGILRHSFSASYPNRITVHVRAALV